MISKTMRIKIFIIVIFALLLVPLCYINQENLSSKENRKLERYVPFHDKYEEKLNFDYGKSFDAFFQDRFLGRIQLIYLNDTIKYYLNHRYVKFISVTADKKKRELHGITASNLYDRNTAIKIYNQLKKFNQYCLDNNIKLYVCIVPQKEMIYMPEFTSIDNNLSIKTVINNFNKDKDINLVFPIQEFIDAKKEIDYPLFYYSDSHGTIDGAFVAYNALMKLIKKDFPNIKIVKSTDFDYFYDTKVMVEDDRELTLGNGCQYASIPDYICNDFHTTVYRYYKHKNFDKMEKQVLDTDDIVKSTYFYPYGSNLKLMIFGDSFEENLMDILPFSFKNILKIRLNGPKNMKNDEARYQILKYYGSEIQKFKPDIIVLYVGYASSKRMRNLAILD